MILQELTSVVVRYWLLIVPLSIGAWLIKNKFHNGLNKYPGPVLAGFTDWWRFFDVWGRKAHHTHIALHEKHGDIVRLGPNVLSFGNPKAIKEIYGLNKGYTKTAFYQVQNATSKGRRIQSLFSSIDEDYHARFRRCVNAAFSMSTLVSYEPLVDSTSEVFLDETQKRFVDTGESCDFARWLQFYAFDVIGELTWSKRLGFIENFEDVDGIIDFIARMLAYAGPVGQQPWIDWTLGDKNPLKMLLGRWGLWDTTSPIARFAADRSSERRAFLEKLKRGALDPDALPAGVDFLTRFTAAQKDHPEFMTDFQVLTATVSLVFAGSDTTAISLSSIFHFLLTHPAALTALLSELNASIASGTITPHPTTGLLSWSDAQKLPYLDAVITESFRLYPAVGLLLERTVPPSGATICGAHIPAGTTVGCNAWVLHRRPELFGPDADAFRPERWLEAAPAKAKEMRKALFHFGAGARTCIGRNISTLEVYKLVPSFLRRFEIEWAEEGADWTTENCWFVRQLDFNVRFRPRRTARRRSSSRRRKSGN